MQNIEENQEKQESQEKQEVNPLNDLNTLCTTFKDSLFLFFTNSFKKIDALNKKEDEKLKMKYQLLLYSKDLSMSFFEVMEKAEKKLYEVKSKIYSKKKHKK